MKRIKKIVLLKAYEMIKVEPFNLKSKSLVIKN